MEEKSGNRLRRVGSDRCQINLSQSAHRNEIRAGSCVIYDMLEGASLRIALALYKGRPIPALLLAHQLMAIKQCIQRGEKGIPDAIKGLDLAIDSLFLHTDFYKVASYICGDWRAQSSLSKKNDSDSLA